MAKKSFKAEMETHDSSAAMAFISRRQDEETTERKSKRLNLLIKPSLYDAMRKIAHMERTSVNNLIDIALQEYTEAHADRIEQYKTIYGEE